jgi:hypothetical protein
MTALPRTRKHNHRCGIKKKLFFSDDPRTLKPKTV